MAAKLVHYVSPFGSPAHMTRERAEHHLAEDDKLWCELQEIERKTGSSMFTEDQRRIGPPRIEGG